MKAAEKTLKDVVDRVMEDQASHHAYRSVPVAHDDLRIILKAYDQGWAAYGNDRPCEANPYRASVRLEQHNAWRKGWAECPAPGAEGGL